MQVPITQHLIFHLLSHIHMLFDNQMAGHNPQMMNQQMHNTQVPLPQVPHPQQVPHTQGAINSQNPSAASGQPGVQGGANARLPMGFRRIPPNRHRPMTADKLSIHEAAKLVIFSLLTLINFLF